jgi:outer membrane protein assembly factor BamD
MSDKDYDAAIEYFTKLKERYPFSPYTPDAELALGDAYFLDEQYKAAVESYKEFESLHPRAEGIPYVLFQIGVANVRQFESIDRPQTNMQEALQYFRRVKQGFPNTRYAQECQDYIHKCRRYQAKHELYLADFYWRTEKYGAAWKRYSYVIEEFSDLPQVQSYAQEREKLAYLRYQESLSQQRREQEQGSWKQWFDWL